MLDVMAVRHYVQLSQQGRVFQVAIRDPSRGIGCGDEGVLDVRGKGLTPVASRTVRRVEHAAHSCLGGISGAEEQGALGDQFGEVRGARTEAGGQAAESV